MTAGVSGSATYGSNGIGLSGQANIAGSTATAHEGTVGTSTFDTFSANAGANANVSMTGGSVGAGANADVFSASQTLTLGPVSVTATGNFGIGAEASAKADSSGVSASLGVTSGLGGTLKVSVDLGKQNVSGGAKAEMNPTTGTLNTTTNKPTVAPTPSKRIGQDQ